MTSGTSQGEKRNLLGVALEGGAAWRTTVLSDRFSGGLQWTKDLPRHQPLVDLCGVGCGDARIAVDCFCGESGAICRMGQFHPRVHSLN